MARSSRKEKAAFFKARALISLPRVKLCAGLPHKTSVVQIKVKISWNYVEVEIFIKKSVTIYVWLLINEN